MTTAPHLYRVPDISCDHCKRAIESALREVPGVERVEVDVAEKTVAVSGDVGEATIVAGIATAGYEVVD